MRFDIITLFPEMFAALSVGVTGRALKRKLIETHFWNPRDFATDKHLSVDDHPYGGGPGMLMMAEPLTKAIQAAKGSSGQHSRVIYLSPQGKRFDQRCAEALAKQSSLIFLAGRYEGIDQRVIDHAVDEEYSIGDYILSGGELAAMVMIDVIARHRPGVVGDQESVVEDSLSHDLLKYPQYTRPDNVAGFHVPEVLLSGDHARIRQWRLKQSLGRTWLKRPDLLAKKQLTAEEHRLLNDFIEELQ